MTTISFSLICLAMLHVVNANGLSSGVSPVGYNKSALISSDAFTGHKTSPISSNISSGASTRHKTSSISSNISSMSSSAYNMSSSSCCFVVQDTIDVRYWTDYYTPTILVTTQTTYITYATRYIDTTVMTNVSTLIKTLNQTSTVRGFDGPEFPNTNNIAPGPSLTRIPVRHLLRSLDRPCFIPPREVYVFPSVNVINAPAVSDQNGRLQCATTSKYRAECSTSSQIESSSKIIRVDNHTWDAAIPSTLDVTGVNSNVELYFSSGPRTDSGNVSFRFDKIQVSFSKPFVYAPLSDQFPSKVVNENLGYVPQTLIEWMAQQPDYVSKFPGIASCLPGGPSIDFYSYFCFQPRDARPLDFIRIETPESVFSSTITIAGRGCFHPGACPTSAAPGATAVAATPMITREAQSQDTTPSAGPNNPLPPQAPKQLLPAAVEKSGSTRTTSRENEAANAPLRPLPNILSPSPPDTAILPSSKPTDTSENLSADSPQHNHEADSPPDNLAKPAFKFPALAAVLANAFGIDPDSPSKSEDVKPSPGPTPTLSYSISIAPSASGVVINGVVYVPPAQGPGQGVFAASMPIAVGSEEVTQNAASQYVVAGQTLTPGALPIKIQGSQVSLALSANAIVIAGSTMILSSDSRAPAFTVGSEIVTANSASQYVLDGQTLTPGGPAVMISGTRISLASSGSQVVVGSSTIGLVPTITYPPPPRLTFGSQTFTANSESKYIINGQTLIPGSPAITLSGTPISLAPSGTQVVFGSYTKDLAQPTTLPPLTFGSQVFTANSKSEYIINGQTLIPGGPAITVSGTRLSLAPSATQYVIGSSTIGTGGPFTPPPLTFHSQTYTANADGVYVIGSQTLIPGSQAITLSGTRISLAPSGTQIVIGSSTIPLSSSPSRTLPALTIASQTYTANGDGAYVIGSQTLTPGGSAITVLGTRLSLAPSGTQLVIGTSTIPLSPLPTLPVLTIASQTYIANAAGAYVIAGQTLTPGASGIVVPGSLLVGAEASASVHEAGSSRSGVSNSVSGTQRASGVLANGDGTSTLELANATSTGSPIFTGTGAHVSTYSLHSMWWFAFILSILTVMRL